jgi:hypothetical protein
MQVVLGRCFKPEGNATISRPLDGEYPQDGDLTIPLLGLHQRFVRVRAASQTG